MNNSDLNRQPVLHPKTLDDYDMTMYLNYYKFLEKIHGIISPEVYLEIGVRDGDSLKLAFKSKKIIAIDPIKSKNFVKNTSNLSNLDFFLCSSDEFFLNSELLDKFKDKHEFIDMAFIDGMHLFEYYLRDFINIEKYSKKNSVIILHDTIAVDKESSERKREQSFWTGDVWKIVPILNKYREDLKIFNITDCYTGILCVTNLNSKSKVLEQNYESILNEYTDIGYEDIHKYEKRNLCKFEEFYTYIKNIRG